MLWEWLINSASYCFVQCVDIILNTANEPRATNYIAKTALAKTNICYVIYSPRIYFAHDLQNVYQVRLLFLHLYLHSHFQHLWALYEDIFESYLIFN